jgi:AsmA protein
MKPLKLLAYVAAGLAALLVLAIVAVALFVDPNDYRDTIEQRVAAATGRTLRIEGDVGLDLFPWIALDVGRVTLGNPAGFGAAPFLQADRLRIGARLLPLLRGRLEARRVSLDGLRVELVTRADGTDNWSDLAKRPSTTGGESGSGLRDVRVAGVDLTNGSLVHRNEAEGSVTRLTDVELHTGALGGADPVDVELAGRLDSGEGTAATRFELDANAALDPANSRATLRDLQLEGERTAAPALPAGAARATNAPASKPTPFRVTSPELAIDWGTGTLAPARFDVQWGELPLRIDVRGERLTGDRLLSGRVDVPQFAPRGVARSLGVELPATRDPKAFGAARVAADFRLTPTALQVDELDARLDGSKITGRAGIADLERGALAFDLAVDALDVDTYRAPVPAGAAADGAREAPPADSPPTALPFDTLRALQLDGRLAIGRLTLAGLTLTELRVPVRAAGGDLRIAPTARLFGGTLGGRGLRLDATRSPAKLELAHEVRGMDAGAAVKAYTQSDRLSGRLDATVTLQGTGTTDAALLDSLSGPIVFAVADGALEGIDLAYELQRARALFRREAAPARAGAPRTPFQTLRGDSRLAGGVLTSDPLRLETAVLSVTGQGTFRLSDQAIDYRLTATVRDVSGATPGAAADAAALADLRSLEIPITVGGTVQDPKVRPDVSALAKARLKRELDERRDEAGQKLQDKVRDRLNRLLGR